MDVDTRLRIRHGRWRIHHPRRGLDDDRTRMLDDHGPLVLDDDRTALLVEALDAMLAGALALAFIVAPVVGECRGRNADRGDGKDDSLQHGKPPMSKNYEPIGLR